MQGITVRSETEADLRAIDVVHLSAFEGDEEVGLIEALRGTQGYDPDLSLLAEFNGRIVGHVLLSKARLQRDNGFVDVFVLAPMAVVPSQSHRGIGSELVDAAVARAKECGCEAIIEVGQPEFYKRFGFQPASNWNVQCNLPVPSELITALELNPGTLDGGGTVIYPPQFLELF